MYTHVFYNYYTDGLNNRNSKVLRTRLIKAVLGNHTWLKSNRMKLRTVAMIAIRDHSLSNNIVCMYTCNIMLLGIVLYLLIN